MLTPQDSLQTKSILETGKKVPAPKADQKIHKIEKHGDTRLDPFFWLKERAAPEVLDHLRAENHYTNQVLAPTAQLQETLFSEMKARIVENDCSVPQKDQNFYYYHRYEVGKEYPILCRKEGSLECAEEILLDSNELAKGYSYFYLGETALSLNHQFLAFAIDTSGRRIHTIYIKDLITGETFKNPIKEVTGNMAWANDNKTLFYTRHDPETLRAYQVYRHTLNQKDDALVLEENDSTFRISIFKTASQKFIIADSSSTLTSESRYLDADTPEENFQVFQARQKKHEYSIDHGGDRFFIRTNYQAQNFRLMEVMGNDTTLEFWKEVIPYSPDILLEGFHPFKSHVALEERRGGLIQIRIYDRSTSNLRTLKFDDPVFLAHLYGNREYNAEWLRIRYESLTQPDSTFDYHLVRDEKILRKQREVPGYTSSLYESKRLSARSQDGTEIPISLVHRKDLPLNSETPCLLYGYGSYGISIDPSFSIAWVSLLNRGFIVAIAHIRGGSEMGRHWYEQGRQLKKKNTFLDFIACSEFLIQFQITSKGHLYAMGGSAGGLLMGAIINARPDLYRGVVANVPFVDVLTTMLDETIPLTTGEYDEWGNPNDPQFYQYIKSYSPYDNLQDQTYPHLLVTTGLHDSQVQYWEPAKWVAKLRTFPKASNLVLLWTDLEAGHGGKAGRYDRLREFARIYAFLIALEDESVKV